MYKLQATPDATATLDNGQILTPILTLKDECGGVSHIVRDDSCFVLVNRTDQLNNIFGMSYYWYSEAVDALVKLVNDGVLKYSGANVMIYFIDGKQLPFPLAKAARDYKTDRWLPLALNKGEKWDTFAVV